MKAVHSFRCFALSLLVVALAWAQSSGSITGVVSMGNGNPIGNATVQLTNLDSNATQTATTDMQGQYHFNGLAGGRYRINTSSAQFTGTPSDEITLDPARPKTVNITVQGGTAVATFSAVEATPSLDTKTPQVQAAFNTRYAQYLPQANYITQTGVTAGAYNLALDVPGIASNNNGAIVGGQRPWANNYYVDGTVNVNPATGAPLVYIPNEATTEVSVYLNQQPPEWGHALGGQFNTEVRTGTNQFHGSLYDYLQNRNLNAVDQTFANQGITDLPRYDQNRLGGSFGFPIIANKLFFFGDFEYIPLGYLGTSSSPVYAPTAAGYSTLARLSGVSSVNLGLLQSYAGAATTASSTTTVNGVQIPIGILAVGANDYQNQYIGLGALDWKIGNSDSLRGRYSINELHANNDGAILPAFYSPLSDRSMMASAAEYHTFSPVLVNELRFAYDRYDQNIHQNGLTYPGLSSFPNTFIEQDLNLGLGSGYALPFSLNAYQLSDNLTWTLGRHSIKIGYDGRRYIGPLDFTQLGAGSLNYRTLGAFLTNQTSGSLALPGYSAQYNSGDRFDHYAYLNDSWQVRSNFTVNIGVKYEYVSIPAALQLQQYNLIADAPGLAFNTPQVQSHNFAPLVGIAWSPGFVKNSVFRAGFGMNYDPSYSSVLPPSVAPGSFGTATAASGSAVTTYTPSVSPLQARAATTTYIGDQQLPYSMQWNASFQQQVFHRMVAEIRYMGVKSVYLPTLGTLGGSAVSASNSLPVFYSQPGQAQLDALTTTLPSLQALQASNPYSALGFTSPISTIQSNGWSWYNGLQATLSQRFTGGFQMIAAYTYSHLFDNLSGPMYSAYGIPSVFEQQIQPGTSVYDHRQRGTLTGLWDVSGLPGGPHNIVRDVFANVTMGGTYTYQSPSSLLLQSGVDTGLAGVPGYSSVVVNPNGVAGTGSGVSPLNNSAGQVVGYLVNNPNARYIAGAAGVYTGGGRVTLPYNPVNNFDATVYKKFAVRDRFSFEIHGDAYNLLNHPQFTGADLRAVGSSLLSPNLLIPGTASFGNIESAFPSNARTLQVGLRLIF